MSAWGWEYWHSQQSDKAEAFNILELRSRIVLAGLPPSYAVTQPDFSPKACGKALISFLRLSAVQGHNKIHRSTTTMLRSPGTKRAWNPQIRWNLGVVSNPVSLLSGFAHQSARNSAAVAPYSDPGDRKLRKRPPQPIKRVRARRSEDRISMVLQAKTQSIKPHPIGRLVGGNGRRRRIYLNYRPRKVHSSLLDAESERPRQRGGIRKGSPKGGERCGQARVEGSARCLTLLVRRPEGFVGGLGRRHPSLWAGSTGNRLGLQKWGGVELEMGGVGGDAESS